MIALSLPLPFPPSLSLQGYFPSLISEDCVEQWELLLCQKWLILLDDLQFIIIIPVNCMAERMCVIFPISITVSGTQISQGFLMHYSLSGEPL